MRLPTILPNSDTGHYATAYSWPNISAALAAWCTSDFRAWQMLYSRLITPLAGRPYRKSERSLHRLQAGIYRIRHFRPAPPLPWLRPESGLKATRPRPAWRIGECLRGKRGCPISCRYLCQQRWHRRCFIDLTRKNAGINEHEVII